jgi:hypothetical protein
MTVIYRYLDCGDLHMGFARVRCEGCGHNPRSHVSISWRFPANAGNFVRLVIRNGLLNMVNGF